MRSVYGQELNRLSISCYKGIMHVKGNFYIEHAKIQAVYNLQPLKRKFQQHVSII